MNDRLLPHNLSIERAFLSAMFIDNGNFDNIEHISPDDFYKPAHGKIYHAIKDLLSKKEPADLQTVANELAKSGDLESIGGPGYLIDIADNAPVAVNAPAYAKSIKDLSVVRSGILACMEIIDDGYSTKNPDEFVSKAQNKILSLQTTNTRDSVKTLDDLCISGIERIKKIQAETMDPGLNFGMPTLRNAMRIFGSKLIVLAGRPAMGKTALMLSIAKFLGMQDVKSTIISLEMDADELTDRYLSEESNINALGFYSPGFLSEKSIGTLEASAVNLACLPINIDDSGVRGVEDVERKARKAVKDGSKIIFIDQLSKIPYHNSMTQFAGYTHNCNRIAALKKELRTPIVLLAQLNRSLETRIDKMPMMSDLKQTGAIEEDADIIFFLYRPGYYEQMKNPKEQADQSATHIILAKNRNGATGVERRVLFNAKRGMFKMGF